MSDLKVWIGPGIRKAYRQRNASFSRAARGRGALGQSALALQRDAMLSEFTPASRKVC
jgi:hypothetical protein